MRRLILISILTAVPAVSQALSVGVLGGAPFQDVVNKTTAGTLQSLPKSTNFTIGPSVRVNLPAKFRLEVDALYRPYSFTLTGSTVSSISAKQWRVPALLQYRFGTPVIAPFVEGGLSFDTLSGLGSAAKAITSGPGQLLHQSDASVVLGGGIDVKIPFLRLSGELRYTRQSVSNFAAISNLNQAEVLFGVHF